MYYLSLLLVVGANLLYHVSSKSIPRMLHPIVSLCVTYTAALLMTGILLLVFPVEKGSLGAAFKAVNWSSWAVGLAAVGLEAGFLLAYRAGWNISTAALAANVTVALLLVPAGLLVFREHLNLNTLAGVFLCVLGILFISRGNV